MLIQYLSITHGFSQQLCTGLDCSLFPLIVESDCLEAVSLLNSHRDSYVVEGIHVSKIQRSLVQLNVTEVFYRSRKFNRVVNSIARFIVCSDGYIFWLE